MKKRCFISLILAVLMLAGLCTVGASAADAVTAESLAGNQLTDYIVSDLTLPDGTTWTSSNQDVISNEGVVTRPLAEDAQVTMTDGTNSFTFTVKAQTTKVLAQNSFYYPDKVGVAGALVSGLDGWKRSASFEAPIVKDGDGNHYITQDYSTYSNSTSYTPESALTGKFTVGFDLMATLGGSGINVRLDYAGTPKSGEGDTVTSTNKNILVFQSSNGIRYYHYNGTSDRNDSGGSFNSSAWTELGLSFDMDALTYSYSLNGRKVAGDLTLPYIHAVENYNDYNWSITSIVIRRADNSDISAGVVNLDNFKLYTSQSLSNVIGMMSDAEKVQYYAKIITADSITNDSFAAIRSNLTLDAAYSSYTDSGVTVSWASANPGIAKDGTVTCGALPQTGALTATITAGAETVTKAFECTVAPAGTETFQKGLMTLDFEDKAAEADVSTNFETGGSMTGAYYQDATKNNSMVLKASLASDTFNSYINTTLKRYGDMTDRYMISADLKYTPSDGDELNDKFYFDVYGNGDSAYLSIDFTDRVIWVYHSNGSLHYAYALPENVQSDQWFNLAIDTNVVSRSFYIYLNGEQLNRIPHIFNNLKQNMSSAPTSPIGIYPMRAIKLRMDEPGTVYMDNLAVNRYTDGSTVLVDAALKAALLTYGGIDMQSDAEPVGFVGTDSFATYGPTSGATYAVVDGTAVFTTDNPASYVLTDTSGAQLSYQVNGENVTGYTPITAGTIDLTVTATLSDKTESKTVTIRTAPVAFLEETVTDLTIDSLTMHGAYNDQEILVAVYDATGSTLQSVTSYAGAATVTLNQTVANGSRVKIFALDDDIRPLAYAKSFTVAK